MKYTAFAVRVSANRNPPPESAGTFACDAARRVLLWGDFSHAQRHARRLRKELPTMYVKAVRVAVDVRVFVPPAPPVAYDVSGCACPC